MITRLITVLPLLLILSCSFNKQETFIIADINTYDSFEENKVLAKDLISYDYGTMIAHDLKITDNEVLKNITWQYFIEEESQDITFRLVLNNKAREEKNRLVPFFENFVHTVLIEYKLRKPYLNTMVEKANVLLDLADKHQYDSIWQQAAPAFKERTTQDSFYRTLDKREHDIVATEKKDIIRHVYSDLGNGFKGEFYVIYYVYGNNLSEKITLQRTGNKIELLGYGMTTPNQ